MEELKQSELVSLFRVKIELFEGKQATSSTTEMSHYYKGKIHALQLAITRISKYGGK